MKLHRKAFTLIELLVVISIISIISTLAFINVQTAQQKARDSVRMSDVNSIKGGLSQFFGINEYYPGVACSINSPQWDCNGYDYDFAGWNILGPQLSPYLVKLPKDPQSNANVPWNTGGRSYSYGNVFRYTHSDQYDLTTQLEYRQSNYRCEVNDYKYYFDGIAHWCTAFGGNYDNMIYEASPK